MCSPMRSPVRWTARIFPNWRSASLRASSGRQPFATRSSTLVSRWKRSSSFTSAAVPEWKHFYLVDESSLASTNQMREFLVRLGPHDRVLLIGDLRQHQSVEAGRPFEQLQEAG